MSDDFVGSGWHFPVERSAGGQIAMAGGDPNIQQSIWIILSTAPGERLMRPDFGCGIHDLVFAANSPATAGQVADRVRRALALWEPRIDVEDVRSVPDPANPALLLIEIDYRLRRDNSRFNLVYPFYLE
jgi:uncharacterized protein